MGKATRAKEAGGIRSLAAAAFAIGVPLVVAFHWGQQGWRGRHENYPSRPQGYTQIVNRFSQPCL